jgi:hypothetical protein
MISRFFTFGAGSKFIEASRRLEEQANRTDIFHEVVAYTNDDLRYMSDFWSRHGDFVENNPRVYGYGIWKPYLVLKELEGLQNGDVLFYADAGCEFDLTCEEPNKEFQTLTTHLDKYKFIGTLCNWERSMNKMDLVVHLDMLDHPGFMTKQIQATTFVMKKCDEVVALVQEWYDTCCHYHLLNDEPSQIPNRKDYNEHKHDQSILSLLLKKRGFYENVPREVTAESVICISRNRSGVHYPACRVTGSIFYSLHFGDEFIEGNQIIQMSKLVRQYNPQYVLETGFGSGRTAATVVRSCRVRPILTYVNCEKNYHLYDPVSVNYSNYFNGMCPFFKLVELRSGQYLRKNQLEKDFPKGIDWFTVDGDPTYEGCLCELVSVLPYMRPQGIIYIVRDRNQSKNENVRDATDTFEQLHADKLVAFVDDVMGREIKYFQVLSSTIHGSV